ncbi:MAG: hypothetical protein K6U74_14440 [Firmicutes bacterium]|nr:hypothetical protein [Bacillota bacterium]
MFVIDRFEGEWAVIARWDSSFHEYDYTGEFEEKSPVMEIVEEYEEDNFWNELINRLYSGFNRKVWRRSLFGNGHAYQVQERRRVWGEIKNGRNRTYCLGHPCGQDRRR